ncbi:hypothetical protein Tco_0392893 [Tanacetum coccineum]
MRDDSIPKRGTFVLMIEDFETDHQSKANSRKDWWKPLPEEERPANPEPTWTIPSSTRGDWRTWTDFPEMMSLTSVPNVGGIGVYKLLTDSKGSCPALSISKIKVANYPNFGLELLVPEQMWIDDVVEL